jgi:hypothetical protein
MSARLPVDSEHAWVPCPYCGELCYPGIAHSCYDDEGLGGGEGIVRAVVISLLLIALFVLVVEGRWP